MFLISSALYSVRSTAHKGRGVFAKKDIPAGTVIGDYVGTLMSAKDENEPQAGLYTFSLNDTIDVLADPRIEGVHLINHSCMPNCDTFSQDEHVLYVATRHIFKGEELTVDYCMEPPKSEKVPCTHTCRCGTLFCRGTMHVSAEAHTRWEALPAAENKKSKTALTFGPIGSQLLPLSKYPSAIKDFAVWDISANTAKKPMIVRDKKFPTLKQIRSLLRESGRPLLFTAIGYKVTGVHNGVVFGYRI